MGLGVTRNTDMDAYLDGAAFTANIGITSPLGGRRAGYCYIDKLSRFLCPYKNPSSNSADGFAFFDPALVDNASGGVVGNTPYNTIGNRSNFCVGAYDPQADDQKLYRWPNSITGSENWIEVSLTAPDLDVTANPFPNAGTENPLGTGPTDPGDVGYYDDGAYDAQWLFFPEWGKAFTFMETVRISASATRTNVPVLIDLATGVAEWVEGIIGYHETTPTEGQGGPLFGSQPVSFKYPQFVPDSQSTGAAPKGRLIITSDFVLAPQSARPGFVKVYDWNPFGVSGTPIRQHLRLRLVSRMTMDLLNGFVADTIGVPASSIGTSHVLFDPRANELVWPATRLTMAATRSAGETCFLRYSIVPVVDSITPPVERFPITTNRIVELRAEARGDLNERIGGIPVTWSASKVSTQGEAFSGLVGTGQTYQLANATAGAGGISRGPLYPLEVRETAPSPGVLVEGVDWSIVDATGIVTIITDATGRSFEADYTHLANPVQPAHGTVLTASSSTDEDGRAATRISYPDDDDLVGHIDQYSCTDS